MKLRKSIRNKRKLEIDPAQEPDFYDLYQLEQGSLAKVTNDCNENNQCFEPLETSVDQEDDFSCTVWCIPDL